MHALKLLCVTATQCNFLSGRRPLSEYGNTALPLSLFDSSLGVTKQVTIFTERLPSSIQWISSPFCAVAATGYRLIFVAKNPPKVQ